MTLCLPFLRWVHRFGRPNGVSYPLTLFNKIKNYFIGHKELNLNLEPIYEHFSEWLTEKQLNDLLRETNQQHRENKLLMENPQELVDAGK
jgi:hypothetical protein